MPSLTTLTPAAECWSGEILSANYVAPSLQPHYRTFNTTTNNSAPICWHRYLAFQTPRLIAFPFTSNSRFPRSDTTPVLRSCLLYSGCRSASNQVASELIPRQGLSLGFDNEYALFGASSEVRFALIFTELNLVRTSDHQTIVFVFK